MKFTREFLARMKFVNVLIFCVAISLNSIKCQYRETNIAYLYRGYKLPGLVEFGPIYGDKILPRKDDSSTGPLKFPVYFPYFNKQVSQFYINTNGIISFETSLSSYDGINHSNNISYLAVFGSDIDTRFNGFIYHRQILDHNTLEYLSEYVNTFVNLAEGDNQIRPRFLAEWAYMVTWHNVEPHRRYNELNNNTFQAVIFTDRVRSFVMMNYLNLTWPNSILKSSIKVGFNVDNVQHLLIENNLQSEFSLTKNQEIITKLVKNSNINYERGKWLFRLDKRDLKLEEPFLRLVNNNNLQTLLNTDQSDTEVKDLNLMSNVQIGELYGDLKLAKNDDGYIEVRFKKPIKFPMNSERNNNLEKLFIHTNGLVSFDQEISYSGEITSDHNLDKRYIAPLWSDIDSRYKGEILYREISDLKNISRLINDFNAVFNLTEKFKPTWAFMVTWVNAEPYRNKNTFFKNTFQLIMFTDSKSSYVYFQYFDITWPCANLHKNIQIGFNIDANHSFILKNFDNEKFSLNSSKMKSEKLLREIFNGSNMNKKGQWVFRLDEIGNTESFMKSAK